MDTGRRTFLKGGLLGLAGGLGASALLSLRANAQPTAASGSLGGYEEFLAREKRGEPLETRGDPKLPDDSKLTEDNILGPFYRQGAPYRGKVTPPLEPGQTLLVLGRVWAHDTRKPLAGAVLDVWQANDAGRYDNDNPAKPPQSGVFLNRARDRKSVV